MKYFEGGNLEIEDKDLLKAKDKQEKPVLSNGTIVFCRGNKGTG